MPEVQNLANEWQWSDINCNVGSLSYAFKDRKGHSNVKFNPDLPPPRMIPYGPHWSRDIFGKWPDTYQGELEMLPDKSLKLVDPTILNNQRGLLGDIAKQLAVAIFTGGGLSSLSPPIRIHEPRSSLERLAEAMSSFCPFFTLADQATDPVVRVKLVLTGVVASLSFNVRNAKPLSPLLGET